MTSYLPPSWMQLNQGPHQRTNAVILYHTCSEQLRKCYDNFDKIILACVTTYLTKTGKDSWKCFLTTCCAIYFGFFSWTLEHGSLQYTYKSNLKNGASYGQSYYRTLTGNHTSSIEWYQFQWTWLTLDREYKVPTFFDIEYQKRHEIEPVTIERQ